MQNTFCLTQKNTLLQVAQVNAEIKTCKRVFFSPHQEKIELKNLPPFKKIKNTLRTMQTRQDSASIVNRFVDRFVLSSDIDDFGQKRRASANMNCAKNQIF